MGESCRAPRLNLVECWFAELTNREAHRSVTELEADFRQWINEWNADPRPLVWNKTADQVLDTLAAYCQRIDAPDTRSAERIAADVCAVGTDHGIVCMCPSMCTSSGSEMVMRSLVAVCECVRCSILSS
jgi:hypothetical protein